MPIASTASIPAITMNTADQRQKLRLSTRSSAAASAYSSAESLVRAQPSMRHSTRFATARKRIQRLGSMAKSVPEGVAAAEGADEAPEMEVEAPKQLGSDPCCALHAAGV